MEWEVPWHGSGAAAASQGGDKQGKVLGLAAGLAGHAEPEMDESARLRVECDELR